MPCDAIADYSLSTFTRVSSPRQRTRALAPCAPLPAPPGDCLHVPPGRQVPSSLARTQLSRCSRDSSWPRSGGTGTHPPTRPAIGGPYRGLRSPFRARTKPSLAFGPYRDRPRAFRSRKFLQVCHAVQLRKIQTAVPSTKVAFKTIAPHNRHMLKAANTALRTIPSEGLLVP